jgi:large subunit ribosomal protein L18
MANTNPKLSARLRRKKSIRKDLQGTAQRPRMSIFRSARHIYVQVIDDVSGRTLASASSLKETLPEGATGGNREGAKVIGQLIAERSQANGVSSVVFDRNGYLYYGRLVALADVAREAGLQF